MYKIVLGVFLCCVACQPQEKAKSEGDGPAPPAVAKPMTTQTSAVPQLELLAVGDSIGPRPVDVSRVGASQLQVDSGRYVNDNALGKHFLFVEGILDEPLLLYRANPRDTVWTQLELLSNYEHGSQQMGIDIKQANLDGKGRPEVLLTFSSADYGSGGGTRYESSYLLDVTPYPPLLLLQARTSGIAEAFPAYAAMHGDTLADGDAENGYSRQMKLTRRELVVGPVLPEGNHPEDIYGLTKLPAGHYRYQQGRMYRVKQ